MPTQTATCTPGDTQADSRTGAAGHTHMGTREEAGRHSIVELKGWDTPTGDQEQSREKAYAHTHAQVHREMLSHRGKEESLSPTRRKSLSSACMHACTHSNCAQPHNRERLYHSEAHTCSHVPSHAAIIVCHDARCHAGKNKNAAIHQYMCTQLSNKYFPGFSWGAEVLQAIKSLLPRKSNSSVLKDSSGAKHRTI